jgi:uncharacterized protein
MKTPFQLRVEHIAYFEGKQTIKLLHLSDIHVWFSNHKLSQIKAQIISNKPNLVVMTGDYFDFPYGAKLFKIFLAEIAQLQPVVFIRGNHEFVYGKKIADSLLDVRNCFCVENEIYTLALKSEYSINIAALKLAKEMQLRENQLNIGLLHNPEMLNQYDIKNVNLIFAGHLHGGQFIFGQTKSGCHFPASLLYKNCFDRKQIKNTTVLISKGLGDTFPLRYNCPREIIEITID